MKGELTLKLERFVNEWIVSGNATDACRKAGYKGNDKTLTVVGAQNLAKPSVQAAIAKRFRDAAAKSEKKLINTYDEMCEQLAFAKQLRLAAKEYLSCPSDPLRLSITPKAHEIEVTYFDHNDMEKVAFGNKVIEKPKKKTAQLSVLLESLVDAKLEPEKYKIQTVDLRTFALNVIDKTAVAIDQLAKRLGDYAKERENPESSQLVDKVVNRLINERGWTEPRAREVAKELYSEAVN